MASHELARIAAAEGLYKSSVSMTQAKPKYQRWANIKRSRTELEIQAGLERLREEEHVA